MQRRSVCAEVKPSPRKNVPWTCRYSDWYVFHLHRWTDLRPNWRQLQLGTLGKSCAKVEAISDRQIVFLLERQWQAPFYIHGNQFARVHACSGESAGVVLYHFIEVCRNIRHTHRELQTKHLGSAILSIPLQMCAEKPIFVIKSSPCQQPWRSFCSRGCRPQQAQKKALHVNSKVTLTVNGNFCSSISRNEHERSFMSTHGTASIHSHPNITTGRRPVCPELHAIAMQNSCTNVPIIKSTRVANT